MLATRDVVNRTPAGWDDVRPIHRALPEVGHGEIETGVGLLVHRLRYPLVIVSMTGAHASASDVNRVLAEAATAYGVAMWIGSQRAALRDRRLRETYAVARQQAPDTPIIATGGVRSGLDAARAIALGASAVGVARPLLLTALEGYDAVVARMKQFIAELRTALFLTGSATLEAPRRRSPVILGDTAEWLRHFGGRASHPGDPASPRPDLA